MPPPPLPSRAAFPRRALPVLLGGLALPRPVRAAAPGEAAAFISSLGRELPGVVGGARTEAEKRARLAPFLARVVDVPAVARFCLGRYWRLATEAQRTEFVALFLRVITNAVALRVGTYTEGTPHITLLPEQATPEGTDVPTIVQGGDNPPVRVTWLVETDATPMRILDVQAEGMSMRLVSRSDMVSFLDHHGGDIPTLLQALRERTQEGK